MDSQTSYIVVFIILTIMIILQHLFIIHCMNRNKILSIENERLVNKLVTCNNNQLLWEIDKIDPRVNGADVLKVL